MGELTDVRGAVYVPARAFNAYQQWREYDPETAARDLNFADSLGLNAIRTFLSYEHWRDAPAAHEAAVGHLLDAASERSVGVVPVCFESAGRAPTPSTLTDRDLVTACAVQSPHPAAIRDLPLPASVRGPYGIGRTLRRVYRRRSWWDETAAFVERILDRFGDHPGMLALEVMNEPGGWDRRVAFARTMLRVATDHPANVPLTMGCKTLANNDLFRNPGLDVRQFHYNLPATAAELAGRLAEARDVAARADAPVWLGEWQRTREEPPDERLPNYESLASVIRERDVDGDFLWSLLLKPAYLPNQRRFGRLNGLFHEDGAVYSAADARAVAGDSELVVEERREWPAWAEKLVDRVNAPRPG